MSVRLKLLLTGTLLLLATMLAVVRGQSWHFLVCAALGFSWVGDAMLSRFPPVSDKVKEPFVAGMASFALAQIVYCIAFSRAIVRMPSLRMPVPGYLQGIEVIGGVLPVYLLAGILCWALLVVRGKQPAALKVAALVYCELVMAMAAFALSAAFTGSDFVWPLPIGGLLFAISDGIIAARIFQDRFPNETRYERAVWGTYFPAQALLLLGASWLF